MKPIMVLGGPNNGMFYRELMSVARFPLRIRLPRPGYGAFSLAIAKMEPPSNHSVACYRTTVDNPTIIRGCRDVPVMLADHIDPDDAASFFMVTALGLETRQQRIDRLGFADRH